MIIHALQSTLLYAVFYGCYLLFLKKETFFQFNRFYLIAIPFVALLLPLLQLPLKPPVEFFTAANNKVYTTAAETIMTEAVVLENRGVIHITTPINWDNVIIGFYLVGMICAFVFWCYKLAIIATFVEKSTPIYKKGYRIMESNLVQGGFSFLDMIFINPNTNYNFNKMIINHELVHVRQRHSWDLIIHECVRVVFWFNPLLLFAHRDLQTTHEFIVDQQLASPDVTTYKIQLIQSIMNCPEYALTNSFYKSSFIKNRLAMLQKSNSPLYRIFKLVALLPIIAITISYNAVGQTAPANTSMSQQKTIENKLQQDYPKLSEFEYGKIDFTVGLTREELELYQNRKKLNEIMHRDEFRKYINSTESLKVSKFASIMSANGFTVVRDDKGENNLIEIHETLVSSSTSTSSLGKHFKKGMSNLEYRAVLRQIERDKPLSDFIISEKMIEVMESHFSTEGNNNVNKFVAPEIVIPPNKIPTEISTDVPFNVVYKVPLLETCSEKMNEINEIKKCVNDQISKHVNEHFNTGILSKDLKDRHFIAVQFKINNEGNVEDIIAKSKFKELQIEAIRVIELLPTFIPAELENGEKVGVIYSFPIVFTVK